MKFCKLDNFFRRNFLKQLFCAEARRFETYQVIANVLDVMLFEKIVFIEVEVFYVGLFYLNININTCFSFADHVREFSCGMLYYRTFYVDSKRDSLYVGAM